MESKGSQSVVKVRSEGLKVDLFLSNDRVSGFTIDFQNIKENAELKRWLNIVDEMVFQRASLGEDVGPTPSVPAPIQLALPLLPENLPLEERCQPVVEMEQCVEEGPESPRLQPVEEVLPERLEEVKKPPVEQSEGLPDVGDYRDIVHKAVDKALEIVGKDGKQVLLTLLENRYGLREEEIPDHPRAFIDLLELDLGSSAYTVEKEVMKEIRKVAAVRGENLYSVVEVLKEEYPGQVPVEKTARVTFEIDGDESPVPLESNEEHQKPAETSTEGKQRLEDPIPVGFSYSIKDPIPVGFKYHATFSKGDSEATV